MTVKIILTAIVLVGCNIVAAGASGDADIQGGALLSWPKDFSGVAVIPEGICHIGDNAFFRCRNVTGVVFPKSLLSIGDSVFSQCHGLREVVIPATVTNIGARAFYFCGNLTNVVVEASVESIPEGMCGRCRLLAHVGLPKNLRKINADAFLACRSLRSVVIPSGVTTISQKAFALCSNLERVEIPCGLKSIEDRAFAWCYSLANVDGVKKVDELGKDVFLENGLFHRNVGMPGFAKVIRLATEGLLHDDVDRSVNLAAMDRLAAHADDIKIGMSRSDLDGVIRRLGCNFGHGFEVKDDGRRVQISTMIRFGLSSKGGVGVNLKYKNGMVYDIELTEAFKFFAEIGSKRLGFKIGEPEQRWLEVRKYEFIISMKHFTGAISSENEKWAPKSFFIKKNEKEILTFTEKASSLKIGMSQNEVLNLLGVPTITQKSSSKKVNNVHIIIWDYYLIKKDDNGVNGKFDVYLMFVFSSDKILKEVVFCKGSAYV